MGGRWGCEGCGGQLPRRCTFGGEFARCRECTLAGAGEGGAWFEPDEADEVQASAPFDDLERLARGEWVRPGMYGLHRMH